MKRAVMCVNTIDYSFPHKFSKAYLVIETKKISTTHYSRLSFGIGEGKGTSMKASFQ